MITVIVVLTALIAVTSLDAADPRHGE